MTAPEAPVAPARAPRPSRRPSIDDRPKPPWHPVPLVEICVLAGIVLIIVGFIKSDTSNGRTALVLGLALAGLAGLDTAAREHFAGFKSHSLLLAALPAVVVAGALFFARAPWIVMVLAAAVVYGGALHLLRNAFRRRAGVAFRA